MEEELDDTSELLMQLVCRVSAVETILIKNKLCTENELAEELLSCIAKFQTVIEAKLENMKALGEKI